MAIFTVPSQVDLRGAREDLKEFERIAKQSGEKTADELLKAMKAEFRRQQADIQEAQRRGLISRDEARRLGNDVARAFNDQIVRRLDDMRRAGQQNTAEFQRMQRALRNVAAVGGRAGADLKRGFTDQMRELPALVRTIAGAGIIAGFTFITGRIVDLFRNAAGQIRDILARAGTVQLAEESFGALLADRGLSFAESINGLRRATRGLVTDMELMSRANFALLSSLPLTEESLAQLANAAFRLARATGRDATEAFQRLVNGIVKGEQQVLEELGLLTRLEDVLRNYTRETGKNSDALTQQQKILLFFNATMEDAERKIRALGEPTLTAGERLQQFSAFMGNLRDASAEAIAESPRIVSLLEAVGTSAENSADKVQDLANRMGAFIDVALNLGAALEGPAKTLTQTFARITGIQGLLRLGIAVGSDDFDAALAERERKQLAETRLEELRAINDIAAAQEALTRNEREYQEALSRTTISTAETNQLLQERQTILARIAQLQQRPAAASGGSGDPLEGLTGKDLTFRLRELEKQFEATSKRISDLFTLETAPQVVAAVAAIPTKIAPAFKDMARLLEPVGAQLSVLREHTVAVAQAEAELATARIAGDPEGTAAAEERLTRTKERLAEVARDVARLLREGKVSGDVYRGAVEELDKALQAAGVDTKKLGGELATFDDHAQAVVTLARGALSLADSMGEVGDSTRQAVTGVLDLVQGLQQVQAASSLSGLAGALGAISGAGAAFGGLFAIGNAIFGGRGDESAQRQLEALRENTRALRDAAEEIRNMASGTGPLQSAVQAAIDAAIGGFRRAVPAGTRPEPITTIPGALAAIGSRRGTLEDQLRRTRDTVARRELQTQLALLDEVERELLAFMERFTEAVRRDIDLREVAARGLEFELGRRELAQRHESELRDAELAGLDAATIERLKYVQGLEQEAQELAEARAARDFQQNLLDLTAADSGTLEDAIAAARFRAQAAVTDQLDTAQKLLDQGIITAEQFEALAAVLGDDVDDAIQQVIDSFEELGRTFREELELGELEFGPEGARGRRELEIRRDREVDEARDLLERGIITQDEFDRFLKLWDKRIEDFVEDMKDLPGMEDRAAGELTPRTPGTTTTRSLQALTEATGFRIEDLARTQLVELRGIHGVLRAMAAAGGLNLSGFVPPGAGTTVGPAGGDLSLTINQTINAGAGTDARAVAAAAGSGVVDVVDRGIGARYFRRRQSTGDLKRMR